MSKNKNPLKDLDQFLKQQASTFVNPTPLSEKVSKEESTEVTQQTTTFPTQEELIRQLSMLSDYDKNALYDLIIKVAEKQDKTENAMLINTALYLKNTDNWKEAVKEYWKNR